MRVSEGSAPPREPGAGAPSRRFGEAMRRAREGASDEARGAGVRRAAAPRAAPEQEGRLAKRRGARREEDRTEAGAGPAWPAAGGGLAPEVATDAPGAAQLRAVLRALPLAIGPATFRDGAPLSLSLGRALDVDLRATAAGGEVALRPDARLARAAEAELPALVASLRSRGIAVARAEVRARGGRGGGAR
jgi:hypothetical protein